MRLILLLGFITLVGCSTTKYVERQSEELSRAVYATKDSLQAARIDLADKYVREVTRIVTAPENRIQIERVIKTNSDGQTDRVLILPEHNANDKVVTVNSHEYKQLLNDSRIAGQLKADAKALEQHSKDIELKLAEEFQVQNKMILHIQDLEKQVLSKDRKLLKKDIAILWRNIVIVSLIGTIGAGVYLRMKGVL
jgi:hypothetical protein